MLRTIARFFVVPLSILFGPATLPALADGRFQPAAAEFEIVPEAVEARVEGSLSVTGAPLSQVAKLVPRRDGLPGSPIASFGQSVALDGDTAVVGAARASSAAWQAGAATVFVRTGTTWSEQFKLLPSDPGDNDSFGFSVSISGDTVLIGAPSDDTGAGADAGSAYVFVRSGTSWRQQAKLIAVDAAAGDRFGHSVAIVGDTAIVGAPLGDASVGADTGVAYVFARSGTTWRQHTKLVALDAEAGDNFGTSVALSADTAVVGAPYDSTVAGGWVGAVYAFVRSGTAWSQQQKLCAQGGASGDCLGYSVALEGDTLVAGAIFDDAPPVTDAGSARVFVRSGTVWTEQQKLVAGDRGPLDDFGWSVSLAGDSLVVGARLADAPAEDDAGAAHVFVRAGAVWSEQQTLVAADHAADDQFGHAVALSGTTVLAGAPVHRTAAGAEAGAAYAFVRTGATWSQQQELTPSDDAALDQSGYALALEGDTLAVGAPHDSTPAAAWSGSVTVWVRSATGWVEQQKLTGGDSMYLDEFASSVALSGDTLVVGAPQEYGGQTGVAYVFVRSGTTWTQQQKLAASDGEADDQFGFAVSVAGDTLVVGAPRADDGATDAGAVYVFVRSGTSWSEQEKLTAADATTHALFGISVGIAGDSVAVGALAADSAAGASTGAAYVFARSGTGWSLQQKLWPHDAAPGDWFGFPVSLSDDTLGVGASWHDTPAGYEAGAAYVFVRSGTAWSEQQELTAHDGAPGDWFGSAVSLDGDALAVGSWKPATPPGEWAGALYVFERIGATWSRRARLVARDGAANDRFGSALSLSNGRLAVGAYADDTPMGADSGSAYVFEPKLKGDFDRDLHTDLLFRNEPGAYHEAWLMDGAVRRDTRRIEPDLADPAWQVGGVDDFNADGQDDLVLWNSLTGAVEFWFMDGAKGEAVPLTGALPLSTDWRLTATGDFNGDGNPDLVWRNDTSQTIVIWTLRDTVKVGNIIPSPNRPADPNWELVAALDYNGDGARDFVWYNHDSGKVVLWFMDANVVRLSAQFTNPPNAGDHDWKVLAGGDYGIGAWGWVGTNDLLWRNATSGRIVVWYMDRAGNRTSGTFTTPDAPGPDPLDWTLAGPR